MPFRFRVTLPVLLTLAALSFSVPRAHAQTAYGPGGLFIHPTAFTRQSDRPTLTASWLTQRLPNQPQTAWVPVSITTKIGDRAEGGGTYLHRAVAGDSRSSGGAFAKYRFLDDTTTRPAVGIAASYLGGDVQLASAALVASHTFRTLNRPLLNAHIGLQWARRGDIPNPRDGQAVYVGTEVFVAPQWVLVGEYGTRFRFDYKERSSLGIVWRSGDAYQIGVGAVNIGRSEKSRFFVGVGFGLGGNK